MSYIVSIQGGMASGKTTTARYIGEHLPGVDISYEHPASVLEKVKSFSFSKFVLKDYLQIQRLFIEAEVERYASIKVKDRVIFDLGPEEVEFYTLHFPLSIGMDWDIEHLLAQELSELRKCKLDGILFLDAPSETLRSRKEADKNRGRNSFDHYIIHLHSLKREWFLKAANTTFLNVGGKNAEEVGRGAMKWLKSFEF